MVLLATAYDRALPGLMLLLSAGALYVACKAALEVLAGAASAPPGRRALGQWLPIAATVAASMAAGQPEVATVVVFSTSVAMLSLVLGMTTLLAPAPAEGSPVPPPTVPPSRRVWPFVLPAALLTLVAGFGAALTWPFAVALLLLGAAVFGVWREATAREPAAPADVPAGVAGVGRPSMAWVQLLVALALSALGGWAMVRCTLATSNMSQRVGTAELGAILLGPLLVLPTLSTACAVAQHDATANDGITTALVGTVLLNLCVLLPLAVLASYVISAGHAYRDAAAAGPIAAAFVEHAKPLPFAAATWRVENVMLVLLAFFLVPVALGRWAMSRVESGILIAAYVLYVACVWTAAVR